MGQTEIENAGTGEGKEVMVAAEAVALKSMNKIRIRRHQQRLQCGTGCGGSRTQKHARLGVGEDKRFVLVECRGLVGETEEKRTVIVQQGDRGRNELVREETELF